jgi:hypothetical protein
MARPASSEYLKLRGKIFYVRCQYTPAMREIYKANWDEDPGAEIIKSMGTSDRATARFKARKIIDRHAECRYIAAAEADPEHKWADLDMIFEMKPGTEKWLDDGSLVTADFQHITTRRRGAEPEERPNRKKFVIMNHTDHAKRSDEYKDMMRFREESRTFFKPPKIDLDTAIIERYLATRKKPKRKDDFDGIYRTLADWKIVAPELDFATADRPDAQRLVDHMMEEHDIGGSRAKRLVAFIRAAVAVEMKNKNSRVSFNAFDVGELNFPLEDEDGEIDRPSYTQADIEKIKASRDSFNDEQWLMILWHGSTSIRPKALRSVVRDDWECDAEDDAGNLYSTRYFKIRHDKSKKYGKRDIAFPQVMLDATKLDGTPLLPQKIEGPLFTTEQGTLLRQINIKLQQLEINRPGDGKTLYCGRHRAKDMMLKRGVNEEKRRAIMGHRRRMDAHDLYGHGFPQWQIKQAIDKIGF